MVNHKALIGIGLAAVLVSSVAMMYFATVPKSTYLAFAQDQQDVMDVKLNQALGVLETPGHQDALFTAAIDELMESLFVSNLVVLPTAGVPETTEMDSLLDRALLKALNGLTSHIDQPTLGTGDSKAAAMEARNFLQLTSEAIQVIGEQTAVCDPLDMKGCDLLMDTDEGGTIDIVGGFSREVRSPFFINAPLREPVEEVIVVDGLWRGECAPIVKETKGVKVVVRPVKIPIWVEPWYARAKIVGFQTVWVWEFVPAEFLKTISYCNVGGQLQMDVDMEQIRERQLMHFWRFYTNVP